MSRFAIFSTMLGLQGIAAMSASARDAVQGACSMTAADPEQAADAYVGPAGAAVPPAAADLVEPQPARERIIESRNLNLLKAGGLLKQCGKETYALRMTISRRMPVDPLVPPQSRADRIREAEKRLQALLPKRRDLARVDPQQLFEDLRALHHHFKPLRACSLPRVADVLRTRLSEARALLRQERERRAREIDDELQCRKRHGGRYLPILKLQTRLRRLDRFDGEIRTLLEEISSSAPTSLLTQATQAIQRAERVALAGRSAELGIRMPPPPWHGRSRKKPRP